MPKRHRHSTSVTVDIEIDDVLAELDDEDLIAELEARRKSAPVPDDLREVHALLLRGKTQDAIALLELRLFPPRDLTSIYEKARAVRDAQTGRPLVQ